MQPQGSNWKEPTWSWAHSTGSPVSNEKLEAAAKAAWPYAIRCAWTYLYDHAAAYDLMDQALENASGYVLRHPECPEMKLAVDLVRHVGKPNTVSALVCQENCFCRLPLFRR